ncbi:MAG: DNA mismatch repair endonuclease MutL, partial [Spirochaetales bacterium]|nr:DNA mismatch repair endonuclease MutL [Spirochaetales bacterium]
MKSTEKQRAPQVRVLPEHVARKIAAGEVIDRPYATVRELLDNAIDSGASSIDLSLQGGGIDEVTVSDDGCGMDKDDLEVCWLPHATSKISSVEDLESARTLGFRGEALASIAACARLEILTSQGREGLRLSIQGGKSLGIEGHPAAPGTSVSMKDLFYNMPARRRFLKSAQAETRLCTRIFMEKAAAHPEVSFRLFREGKLKQFFPPGRHIDRVKAAWPRLAPEAAWWQTEVDGNGFKLIMVHARPESSRRDRQGIQIYANRRR